TNTSGYGGHNGVKYLTLQKGNGTNVGTMKVALLSLGQSAEWTANGYVPNNDAADIGDFYQWGRVADGHQNIVWNKSANHTNQITPITGGENTSAVVARGGNADNIYAANGQIKSTETAYYGKFITGYVDWRVSANNSLWGNIKSSPRSAVPVSVSGWTYSSNNPCPSGWRIPSRYDFWDLYKGNNNDEPSESVSWAVNVNNKWEWRSANNNAIGGVIITNNNGEKIFLPASGYRNYNDGELATGTLGQIGYYWSSTYYSDSRTYCLSFGSAVDAGYRDYVKAYGRCARCVAEF
ncbi:MAG: hypothetical protein LBB53_05385, partial [Prevotellaceae bacterium]|nr:hypothetical protein [Prevotellaceae bacterium]